MGFPGAREYLEKHSDRQDFFLVSATPDTELKAIVKKIEIDLFLWKFSAPQAIKKRIFLEY